MMTEKELSWFMVELVEKNDHQNKLHRHIETSLLDTFCDYLDEGFRVSAEEVQQIKSAISNLEAA